MTLRTVRQWIMRAILLTLATGVLAAFNSSAAAGAAQPPNDDWENAVQVRGSRGSVSGTTVGATSQACPWPFAVPHSVWYRYRAPHSGFLRLSIRSSTGVRYGFNLDNTDLGWCPNEIANETGPTTAIVRQGDFYYIAVGGTQGSFTLRWSLTRPPPAPNDHFADAQRIFGIHGQQRAVNVHASTEPGEPVHGGVPGGRSIWFKWKSPVQRSVVLNTIMSYPDRPTTIAVYRGSSVSSLRRVAAATSGQRGWARLRFSARRDTTYHIAVDTVGGLETSFGESSHRRGIVLVWKGGRRPPNDDFANAQALGAHGGALWLDEVGATREPGEPIHGKPRSLAPEVQGTVWFRYKAPSDGEASFVAQTSPGHKRPALSVYSGSSVDSLVRQYADGEFVAVERGRTYYIGVANWADLPAPINLGWSAPRTVNDDFAEAVTLQGNAGFAGVCMTLEDGKKVCTTGAGEEPGEPGLDPYAADHTAWYRWLPSMDGRAFFRHRSGHDVDVFVGDTLSALLEVPTIDLTPEMTLVDVGVETEYRIRVSHSLGDPHIISYGLGSGEIPVDSEPPSVAVVSPSAGSVDSGLVMLGATASDDSAAVAVTIFANGRGVTPIHAPYQGQIGGLDGETEVVAHASDPWGNTTTSGAIFFTANSELPGVGHPSTLASGPGTVTLSIHSTPETDLACSIDREPFTPCTSPVVLENLTGGYHWFRVRASDQFDTSEAEIAVIRIPGSD
jgi:hypothetical protein